MTRSTSRRKWWWVAAGLLAVLFLGTWVALDRHETGARVDAFSERFALLAELRRDALEVYVDTVRTEMIFWSTNRDVLEWRRELSGAWHRMSDPSATLHRLYLVDNPHAAGERRHLCDAGDESTYSALHAAIHPMTRLFVEERGYYDLFLIDPAGNILYTVEKESDFATNLMDGPWRDTGLGWVFRQALEHAGEGRVTFSDFSRYPPSDDAPAMFASRALRDDADETVGVLVLQLPTDRLQSLMQFTAGMGESGETYLVGPDLLMRSDSRFSEKSTILRTEVDTDTVRSALDGVRGVRFTDDYRGVRVLSAFTQFDVDEDIRWAVMAEIDEAEVQASRGKRRPVLAGLFGLLYAAGLASIWFVATGAWASGALGSAPFEPDMPDLMD